MRIKSSVTNWGKGAWAADLAASLEFAVDEYLGGIQVRVTVTQETIYRLSHWQEWAAKEDEACKLLITGLNLVQADPDLGTYLELEVAIDE